MTTRKVCGRSGMIDTITKIIKVNHQHLKEMGIGWTSQYIIIIIVIIIIGGSDDYLFLIIIGYK